MLLCVTILGCMRMFVSHVSDFLHSPRTIKTQHFTFDEKFRTLLDDEMVMMKWFISVFAEKKTRNIV